MLLDGELRELGRRLHAAVHAQRVTSRRPVWTRPPGVVRLCSAMAWVDLERGEVGRRSFADVELHVELPLLAAEDLDAGRRR